MGWTQDPWNIGYPALTTPTPFKSQKILFNDKSTGFKFTPTKRRLTTSHLPILEPVLKTTIPSYTIYSNSLSPSIPDILCASPWSFARFCDTCISSIWPFNTVRAVLLMFQICAALVLIFEQLSWLCCTSRTLLSELHKYHSE